MRSHARRLIVWLLRVLAGRVLAKYRPKIVAVTGSVGKTTTTGLVATMLANEFRLRAQPGYNSEIGVPLAILFGDLAERGIPQGVGGWLKTLGDGFRETLGRRDYPEVLVLEMAADRPGDIKYLTSLAPPDIAVVTNVRNVHLERYEGIEQIAEEKSWLVRNLKPNGVAILNFDDTKVRLMQTYASGRSVYYGLTDESNIWADDITHGREGMTATLHIRDRERDPAKSWELRTPLLGRHQLYAVLAGVAAARALGVPPERALAAAASFSAPPGRLRLLEGQDGLLLLDDSYNASPQAMLSSLEVLRGFPGPQRAVLGSMKELGQATAQGHRMVGEAVADWLDELVTVGEEAELIAEAARERGMAAGKIHSVADAPAAIPLVNADGRGGSVLVKGSQAVYLERVVEALLRDPRQVSQLVKRPVKPAPASPKSV